MQDHVLIVLTAVFLLNCFLLKLFSGQAHVENGRAGSNVCFKVLETFLLEDSRDNVGGRGLPLRLQVESRAIKLSFLARIGLFIEITTNCPMEALCSDPQTADLVSSLRRS